MITRIKLVGWKSHLNSEFEFSRGVNALIGIMGSGKSSVMQAISFALFGNFPSLASRKVKIEDMIMEKPKRMNEAVIELEFVANGKAYYIKRVVDRNKKSHAEIRENNKLLEVGPKAVEREVRRILSLDYDLFSRAVYSEQNGLENFLRIPRGARREQIDDMLRLDRYERVRESSVKIKNRLIDEQKSKIKVLDDIKKKGVEEIVNKLEKEIENLKKEQENVGKRLSALSKKREELANTIHAYEKNSEVLHTKERFVESLKSKVNEVENELKKKIEKLSKVGISENIEDVRKNIALLRDEISRLEKYLDSSRKEIAEKNARVSVLERQIKDMEIAREEKLKAERIIKQIESKYKVAIEEVIESKKEIVEKIGNQIAHLEARIEETKSSIDDLARAKGKCPVCNSLLDDKRKEEIIKEKKELLERWEKAIEVKKKEMASVEKERDACERDYEDLINAKNKLKEIGNIEEEVKNNEKEIAILREQIEERVADIKASMDSLNKAREKLEGEIIKEREVMEMEIIKKGIEEDRQRITKMKSDIESSEKEIEHIKNWLAKIDFEDLKSKLNKIVWEEGKLRERVRSLNALEKEKRNALEYYRKDIELYNKYSAEVKQLNEIIKKMDSFIEVVVNTQTQLRERFLETINNVMNAVWEELYPYPDFDRIGIYFEDNDYILKLFSAKGPINIEKASGGERTLASLALRIAFSLAFTPNLRWLILDEPTHNLDRNAIEHFGYALREKINDLVEQVFIITHDEMLADSVTGAIYKLERNKETEGATIVRRINQS
ncbi:MAG: hypothetical protein DRP03_00275 [Candidatus Aenigmatarchaeota archaeon]|nr:MAG: hypothetical protein DRP03_00275 [Candidatus Aenigmarchaeota archaeon]